MNSSLWAKEKSLADFFRLEVLLNEEVNDDWQLFVDKVLARLLHADQDVASGVQDVGDLR